MAIYQGEITQKKNKLFYETYRHIRVKSIQITSSGGEVEAAIHLARWVFANKLDIIVEKYCLSSCANYVFPAGQHKTIRTGSVVAWHGNYHHLYETGLWKSEITLRMKKYNQDYQAAFNAISMQVKKLVKLEQSLFADLKVDQFVCWIGKVPPYNTPDFYFLSRSDMQRFGIKNITLSDDYHNTDMTSIPYDIVYIQLRNNKKR